MMRVDYRIEDVGVSEYIVLGQRETIRQLCISRTLSLMSDVPGAMLGSSKISKSYLRRVIHFTWIITMEVNAGKWQNSRNR